MKVKYKTHHLEVIFILLLTFLSCRSTENLYIKENYKNLNTVNTFEQSFLESNKLGVIYRNPRVYNVDYSFELCPDPAKIDRTKDLKLWVPVPSEWDSQKAVKIISVQPPPHAEYADPEHGNRMFFWDFGKEPEKPSYRVDIKFRLESYEVHAGVDPENIGTYDKNSEEYALYTRSTHTVNITPKIKEMAQEAVGDEKNPYLQAKLIIKFVGKKMHYKIHRHDRGIGTKYLLDFPVIDTKTGEEHYEGSCEQYSVLFVALCRAAGIPARTVAGFIGWFPQIEEKDLKIYQPIELELSSDGLAAAQHYMALGLHMWAEFYVPRFGWIPADAQAGNFGHLSNTKLIISKGRDVEIGPQAPERQNADYGSQWIVLNDGRVDLLRTGVYNIARIQKAKVTMLHQSDPFPADGLTSYGEKTFPKKNVENKLRQWRTKVLRMPFRFERSSITDGLNLEQFDNDHPNARMKREVFICHMLRRQMGDEKFNKLLNAYEDLRQKSNLPVPTTRFRKLAGDIYGESLDWFFNQWVNSMELPRLKLENVITKKNKEGWRVHGRLSQSSDTIFQLSIDLAIDTKTGKEMHKLWVENKATDFDFLTQNEPQKLIVDPDYQVLKIQKMPPRLDWFWDDFSNLIVIYGTISEAEANKTAAERFNDDYLGLGNEIIKADIDVNEADLKNKCVILFGRPETNMIAQEFKNVFPIKFDKDKFNWQGVTYDQPTQGVAQIIENPFDPNGVVVLYAGLSGNATRRFCDLYLYDTDASYVIFGHDKPLISGDWYDFDSDLVWNVNKEIDRY